MRTESSKQVREYVNCDVLTNSRSKTAEGGTMSTQMSRQELNGSRHISGSISKERGGTMRKQGSRVLVALLAAMVLAVAMPASAGIVTLESGNSIATIDTESSAGMYQWSVNGVECLNQQWFWFRNDLPEYNDREYSIDEIDTAVVVQGTTFPNLASLKYTDTQGRFSIEVIYMLNSGPGFRTADIMENITVENLSDEAITFDFFQYSDFDLNGSTDDQRVEIVGGNTVVQSAYGDGSMLITLSETNVSGTPDFYEAGIHPDTLDKLMDANVDDLNDAALQTGPMNLTWAFQWAGRRIEPGQGFIISKDKLLTMEPVPEPAGLGLIGIALLGLRRKRR